MATDKDRLFKKLEHIGEFAVRENLANGVYGENRRPLVEEWLGQFDDITEDEAVGEAAVESSAEPIESVAEEASSISRETSSEKWYQGRAGLATLAVLAGVIIGVLVYLFG